MLRFGIGSGVTTASSAILDDDPFHANSGHAANGDAYLRRVNGR